MITAAKDYDHGVRESSPGDLDMKTAEGWVDAVQQMAADFARAAGNKNDKNKK